LSVLLTTASRVKTRIRGGWRAPGGGGEGGRGAISVAFVTEMEAGRIMGRSSWMIGSREAIWCCWRQKKKRPDRGWMRRRWRVASRNARKMCLQIRHPGSNWAQVVEHVCCQPPNNQRKSSQRELVKVNTAQFCLEQCHGFSPSRTISRFSGRLSCDPTKIQIAPQDTALH